MRKVRFKKHNIIAVLFITIIYYLYNNPYSIKLLMYGILSVLTILAIIYLIYNYRAANKSVDLKDIDVMSGTEFEKYLMYKYRNKGYKVKHNGGTGDYGADLILRKDNDVIVVQAKRYSYSVGVKAIQEAISAKEFYRGTQAIVITNNYFTKNALIMAKRCNIELIDRSRLHEVIN